MHWAFGVRNGFGSQPAAGANLFGYSAPITPKFTPMVAQTWTVFANGSPKTRTILPIVAQSRETRDRPPPVPRAFGTHGYPKTQQIPPIVPQAHGASGGCTSIFTRWPCSRPFRTVLATALLWVGAAEHCRSSPPGGRDLHKHVAHSRRLYWRWRWALDINIHPLAVLTAVLYRLGDGVAVVGGFVRAWRRCTYRRRRVWPHR